ncbi:surface-adhesin E family protein [Sphingomonas sp.]|uniref:surface-adhesin E family protein n=1 Tax=Sphingomonas sp. TaxID=28214 RepID=UPI0035C85948
MKTCAAARAALSLLAITSAAPAWAGHWWIVLQKDAVGNSILADADTIEEADQNRRTIWTHKFYSTPEESMSSAAVQYEVDCKERALRERLYTDYDAGSAVLRRGDNTQTDQWHVVSGGSVGASIVDFTCVGAAARKASYLEIAPSADYREVGRFYADPRPVVTMPSAPSPALSPRPAASTAAMQAGQRYKACALAAARRFVASGETAPVVADAALADCASSRRALAAAFAADPAMRSGSAEIAMERFDQLLRQQVQLEVVRAKARR